MEDDTYTSRMCMHQTRQYVDSTRWFLLFLCLAHLGSQNILRASLKQTTCDEGPWGQEWQDEGKALHPRRKLAVHNRCAEKEISICCMIGSDWLNINQLTARRSKKESTRVHSSCESWRSLSFNHLARSVLADTKVAINKSTVLRLKPLD